MWLFTIYTFVILSYYRKKQTQPKPIRIKTIVNAIFQSNLAPRIIRKYSLYNLKAMAPATSEPIRVAITLEYLGFSIVTTHMKANSI